MRLAIILLCAVSALAEPPSPKAIERYKQMLATNPVEGIALDRLWSSATETGTVEALISEYEKAPGFAAKMVLGLLQRKAGHDDDALFAYEDAAKLDARSPLPLLAIGRLELARTRSREAAQAFEKAVALLPEGDPRLSTALIDLGGAWFSAGDAAKAAAAWERTVALAPDDLDLRRRLADAYAKNSLTEQAIKHLDVIATKASPSERAEALQRIGMLYSSSGKPGEAVTALERAVAFTAPDNWMRVELLGQIVRLAQRQHAEAGLETKWRSEAEASPRDPATSLRMVEFYERTGDLEKARAWLEKVTAMLPKHAGHKLRLARMLAQLDQLDAAAAAYDALLAAQPGNADFVFERARLDIQREDGAAARARINSLLAQKADDGLRQRAFEFYQEHNLFDLVEDHLKRGAAAGGEEAVTALARFYFSQRRNEDAMAALARLDRPNSPLAERTAQLLRVAQLMRGQSEYSAAIDVVKKVQALVPDSREALMLLGELEASLTRYTEAREAFARAYELAKTDAERVEADTKSFDTFRAEWPALSALSRSTAPSYAAHVENYIRTLQAQANERKDVRSRLRVARWHAWNGTKAAAMTYASQAIDLDKKDPAPREFMARHLAATGEPARAAVYFRELIEVNPAGREGYLREIGQLESQAGNHRDALGVFEQLSSAKPGDPDAMAELASAQERAGNFVDAAATWRRVLALLPAPRKREASAALLRTLQRLGRHEEASLLLLRAVDETADERERFARFDELLLHAQQNDQMKWLRERFEERRKLRADDYFTAVALGRTRKLLGDKEGAFEMFADAVFSAPNQAEALPDLVREAEDLRKYEPAIRLQEQLTRVVKQDQPDGLLKLASLYAKTGELEGAERTWNRAVARFPRDRAVVRLAADFHRQWGDIARAATLLRKLMALDTVNVRVAAELGELDFAAGRLAEAKTEFEQVLKLTKPVEKQIYPSLRTGIPGGGGSMGTWSGSWTVGSLSTADSGPLLRSSFYRSRGLSTSMVRINPESELRLSALQRLGELAARAGGSERERWVADWIPSLGTSPTEAVWALYSAGENARVLDHIEAAMAKEPRVDLHRQAFISMAIERSQFSRLGDWLNADARVPRDMSVLQQTLSSWARSRPEAITKEMIDGVFGPGRKSGRLEAARAFASQPGLYGKAMLIARRGIADGYKDGPRIAPEVVRWLLSAGETDDARKLLEEIARLPVSSFDAPAFTALRYLCAITPDAARKDFLKAEIARIDPATVDGRLKLVALHALAGDKARAEDALTLVLDQSYMSGPARDGTAMTRQWGFLLRAWGALMDWGMPELADRVWQHTLADEGLLAAWRQDKVPDLVESDDERMPPSPMRSSQFSLSNEQVARDQSDMVQYLLGDVAVRGRIVTDRLRGKGGGLAPLATMLENHRKGAGAALRHEMWKANPADPTLLRTAVESAVTSGDIGMQESIRRQYLNKRSNADGDDLPREFATELASLYERRGELEAASGVIAKVLVMQRSDVQLQKEQAQLLQRMGRGVDAERVLRSIIESDAGAPSARHELALELERRGMVAEALEVRLRFGGGGDAQVPLLYLKNDRRDDALASLEKLAGNMAVYAARSLAEALGMRGEGRLARSVLVATATRVTDPRGLMQVRRSLLTIPGNQPSQIFARRMHERMRDDARMIPELAAEYYAFMERHASRLGLADEFAKELLAAWAEGKGSLDAGVALAQHQIAADQKQAAEKTCTQLLAREDATLRHFTRVDAALDGRGAAALRLRVSEAAARCGWPDTEPTFTWVRLLDDAGQREKAREVLAGLEWLVVVQGGAELLGHAWLSVGDPDRALRSFQYTNKASAPFVSPGVVAGMARAQIARKHLDAARLLLKRAFSDPACSDHGAIVSWLEARGELPRWREAAREFSASPDAEVRLGLALFAQYETRGNFGAALALVEEEPRLLLAAPEGVSCLRLRTFARKAGSFAEAKAAFGRFTAKHVPDAEPELAALLADEAEAGGNQAGAVAHIERAASLAPGSWEFARRMADHYIGAGDALKARQVLARFLDLSPDSEEREPALALWEKAAK